jgi:hypothetical protein
VSNPHSLAPMSILGQRLGWLPSAGYKREDRLPGLRIAVTALSCSRVHVKDLECEMTLLRGTDRQTTRQMVLSVDQEHQTYLTGLMGNCSQLYLGYNPMYPPKAYKTYIRILRCWKTGRLVDYKAGLFS